MEVHLNTSQLMLIGKEIVSLVDLFLNCKVFKQFNK